MLTLTFAGDESGDVSFTFDKGASRYFVVAAIATADPDALRQLLADVRQRSGLPAEYEFSFNALSSAPLQERVFAALAPADFESWAVVVDKTTLPDPFRVMRRLDFYLYFVTELIRLILPAKREGATLILDEFSSVATQRTELRRFMAAREIPLCGEEAVPGFGVCGVIRKITRPASPILRGRRGQAATLGDFSQGGRKPCGFLLRTVSRYRARLSRLIRGS